MGPGVREWEGKNGNVGRVKGSVDRPKGLVENYGDIRPFCNLADTGSVSGGVSVSKKDRSTRETTTFPSRSLLVPE